MCDKYQIIFYIINYFKFDNNEKCEIVVRLEKMVETVFWYKLCLCIISFLVTGGKRILLLN